MLKFLLSGLFLGSVMVGTPGCGGGGSNSSAVEDADQAAIDEYMKNEAETQARNAEEMSVNK